jgi:uncharacterized protein
MVILLNFLYELRRRKVPVGLQEWMTLLFALDQELHQNSLDVFYNLARSILVHTESHFDAYDQAFARCFAGIAADTLELSRELAQWLSDPLLRRRLTSEELMTLESLDLEQLHALFEQRLREQQERHDGGNRWVGTGGTSPFGQGGQHPTGIRVGQQGGGRSAVQVAAQHRYQAYRQDLVLDVRQIQMALRKLRELRRQDGPEELDLDQTVDRTSRAAGDLQLVFRPPRRNRVKVVLLMDVGGSMDPHAQLVSRLFSAAHAARHLRQLDCYYFHNCVYERVYKDSWFQQAVPLPDLLRTHGRHHKLILVGDALMHPMELLDTGGALDYWQRNRSPGIEWLRQLALHFERSVWLNPEAESLWNHLTVESIRQLFPMFPLTLEGLDDAVAALIKGRVVPRAVQHGQ